MITKNEILDIIEMGLKPDGTFYNNDEIAECLFILFDEESKKVFDKGWTVGYNRGVEDAKKPSGW